MTTTTTTTAAVEVSSIPPLDHDEAMGLAETEVGRVLRLADGLTEPEWASPTECPGWTVRDVLAHLLGMWRLQYDPDERARQVGVAAERARVSGRLRIDEMTALQIEERAHLSNAELVAAMRDIAPVALAGRRALPPEVRATPYDSELPGERPWTVGYLLGVIHTRDPWMHRVDIARATGGVMAVDREHDGRIVADVVADWAGRHDRPFTLRLTGPAGGTYTRGRGGEEHELDAVEFCRVLSGRARGVGLLAVPVAF
jgi:uncharacterized protein (TIGR03083 family)